MLRNLFSSKKLAFLALTLTFTYGAVATPPVSNPGYQSGFPVNLSGLNVNQGPIALGDLNNDGVLDIVVGAVDGALYAYAGTGGLLWSLDIGDDAFESKAAIGDIDNDGFNEVVIGSGNTTTVGVDSALFVFDHLGNEQCRFTTLDRDSNGASDGVYSSPALFDLDMNDSGRLEIIFGSWDHLVRALHDDCTVFWERDVFDTVFSSPAIADLDGDGNPEVVIGADSHFEPDPIGTEDGGRLLVLNGADGSDFPGFPIQIDEVISSSPAVGDINGDFSLDIVVGSGNFWGGGEFIYAWDVNGVALPGWPKPIPGEVAPGSSPTLADLDEDGLLEVIINTIVRGTSPLEGKLYALNGDGSSVPGWPVVPSTPVDCIGGSVSYGTPSSPVVADLTGDGHLEVVLPSNSELVVWDRSGAQLSRPSFVQPICTPANPDALQLGANSTVNGVAGIGDVDGDGDLEVIVGGFSEFGASDGAIWAWDFPGTDDPPWGVFRQNQRSTGMISGIFSDGFESGSTSRWSSTFP